MNNSCRVYWGTHGCMFERGHSGPHKCDCWDNHELEGTDNVVNVGAPPYYGPDTKFYGEDVSDADRGGTD